MVEYAPSRVEHIKAIHDAFVALMWISRRQFAQRLQPFGLTMPQFFTLAILANHKQYCTMGDLINVSFQDAPTMTGIIDRLVKMGFVQRTRSETDRRLVLVEATPAGAELVRQVEEKSLTDESFTSFSDEELANFEQLLRYILKLHLGHTTSLPDTDLDTALEKLRLIKSDPIRYYTKLENGNLTPDS